MKRRKSAPADDRKTPTLQGLRPEEFEEFFWKESSLMRRFFPRRYGALVAIVLYYLNRDLGNTEESHAPPPPMGAGLAQGGPPV